MRMKMFTHLLALGTLLMCSVGTQAQDWLLPRVKTCQDSMPDRGLFEKGGEVRLVGDTDNAMLSEFMDMFGYKASETADREISVVIDPSYSPDTDYKLKGFDNEAYSIETCGQSISIVAASRIGVCRAVATLMQYGETHDDLGAFVLNDYPAFKLRGFMHDVGRSFISVDELKKEIKMYARFKVNCFHWHLTENQAWRFEVKKYPQLTASSSMTRYPGMYYTQEECREIDQLCYDYGIVLIPEIDMPGHSEAFQRAMGHSMQTAQGVEELQNILDEVADVFKHAPYIHIGADEVSITYPKFLQTMLQKVHDLGKYTTTWNPISGQNVANYDVDLCQLWSTAGKMISGKANIDCRYNYTNHFDVFADLAGIYLSQIYYADKGDENIAGEISCPWNDRKTPTQEDIIRQNNTWACTIASACRAWHGGGKGYIETQGAVLPNGGEQYRDFADWERRFLYWKDSWLKDEPIPYVKQSNVRWRLTDMMANSGSAATKLPPETEGPKDSYVYKGKTVNTQLVTGAGIYLRHTWGGTVPCIFGNPSTGNTAYAWTYVYSPKEQEVGALIEFQNYGRSEKDPAPAAGNWDRKGSKIWLNDEELKAPNWKNAGKSINNEVDLQDENFTARPPYKVTLKEGWNKVFVKLPYLDSGCRLNKWMWTFVLTDVDGKHALTDIRYSPDMVEDAGLEELQMLISEITAKLNSTVGDGVGYYKKESAAELMAILEEVNATLDQSLSMEEREQQIARLQQAYDLFLAHYKEAGINLPALSEGDKAYWYTLQSKRGNKYAVGASASANISGYTNAGENAQWKFTMREDGTMNIINRKKLYISPASSNNTPLKAVLKEPAKGWTIQPSDADGYVIITSGTAQFNQTNQSGLPVYNWGGGTNTSDEGCQYLVNLVEITDGIASLNADNAPNAIYNTMGQKLTSPATSGIYIVRQAGESQKIAVK